MTKDNYIVILAWMNDLGLSLVEKFVYAIIYGFSQDGDSEFSGSRQYLADWCGCSSLRTIDAALATLVELKLITKRVKVVNNVRFCSYVADCTGRAKIAQGVAQNLPEGGAKIAHNNIVDKIDIKQADNAHTRVAKNISNRFSFRDALIVAGASEPCVDKLMEIRKRKRLNNSEHASRQLISAITTICNTRGVTVDDVLRFMDSQDWGAIRPDWGGVENIRSSVPRGGKMLSFEELMNRDRNRYASQ